MHDNFSSNLAHFRLALLLSLLLLSGAAVANAQSDLPAGPGRVELERMCTRCHGVNVITGQRMSARLWTEEVHDMISRGAVGSDDEVQRLVAYLSTNFGNGQTAASQAGSSATPQRSTVARHTGPAAVFDAWPDAKRRSHAATALASKFRAAKLAHLRRHVQQPALQPPEPNHVCQCARS